MSSQNNKFAATIKYIDENISDDLSLALLSRLANTSKFHFHRQFSDCYAVSLGQWISHQRINKAAYLLAFRTHPVITIAYEVGYQNAESLSRVFKQVTGLSPIDFRINPQWEKLPQLSLAKNKLGENSAMQPSLPVQVEIVNFPKTKIAVFEHHGSPQKILMSVKKFIEWRKQEKLSPANSATYNLLYHDPRVTPDDEFQLDIAAATNHKVAENTYGVVNKTIPSGLCAKVRSVGSEQLMGEVADYLYRQWLPMSGYQLRDFPCFIHRVTLFPDVSASRMITDIYLPIEK